MTLCFILIITIMTKAVTAAKRVPRKDYES